MIHVSKTLTLKKILNDNRSPQNMVYLFQHIDVKIEVL